MIKYDINKKPYEHQGEFSVREAHGRMVAYVRVKDYKTGETHVLPRAKFLLGGLPTTELEGEESDVIADELVETPVTATPVVVKEDELEIDEEDDELVPALDTPVETAPVETVTYIATNTRTREEVSIEGEEGLATFVEKHNLDTEAVEAMLEGKQNTHKKWRVVKK